MGRKRKEKVEVLEQFFLGPAELETANYMDA